MKWTSINPEALRAASAAARASVREHPATSTCECPTADVIQTLEAHGYEVVRRSDADPLAEDEATPETPRTLQEAAQALLDRFDGPWPSSPNREQIESLRAALASTEEAPAPLGATRARRRIGAGEPSLDRRTTESAVLEFARRLPDAIAGCDGCSTREGWETHVLSLAVDCGISWWGAALASTEEAPLDVERVIADTLGDFDAGSYRGPVEVVPYKGESSDDYMEHREQIAKVIAGAIAAAYQRTSPTSGEAKP